MTTFQLRIAKSASRSTKKQAEYYRTESGVLLADRWRRAVSETVRSLRKLPERGALWRVVGRSPHGLRWIPVDGFPKHLVFYRLDETARTVIIVDIIHGARDLELELFRELEKKSQ